MNDFTAVSQWQAFSSGLVQVRLAQEAAALVMHYDFGGAGGFVVARREWSLPLPERFCIRLRLKGQGQPNRLELKLVDASGQNVWWYRKAAVAWRGDWEDWQIESHQFEFAWGPAGGGRPEHIAAVEVALVAEAGGAGCLSLADWQIENMSAREHCAITASDIQPGYTTDLLSGVWRSATIPAWLQLDLQEERNIAALHIVWEAQAVATAFRIEISNDATQWRTLVETTAAGSIVSDIYLGPRKTRWIRLQMAASTHANHVGVTAITVIPLERAGSLVEFLHAVAAREPRGVFPKYLQRQQSYWTVFGSSTCPTQGLLNEEGMAEIHRAGFSLEPFLWVDGRWLTWAEARHTASLADGYLPIPSVHADYGRLRLRITATSAQIDNVWCAWLCYALSNPAATRLDVDMVVAARPFQVVPPWQSYREFGGVHPIAQVDQQGGALCIDRQHWVIPRETAQCGAREWLQPPLCETTGTNAQPQGRDAFGLTQGELRRSLSLLPGEETTFSVIVPFDGVDAEVASHLAKAAAQTSFAQVVHAAEQAWRLVLNHQQMQLPQTLQMPAAVYRTAVAHILLNRDGAAIQPGPRRYARSWIRDGATMCAALLRAGNTDAVRDFLVWYAPFVQADGFVPCCVDREGVDMLVEHDSHGQWMHVVAEYLMFSADRTTVESLLPSVIRAGKYLIALRASRCTPAYETEALHSRRGLIPESVSHEGYLAQPVHSYWDSFWAIRGLDDAAALCLRLKDSSALAACQVMQNTSWADTFANEAKSLREAVTVSIARVISERGIPHIPGSVEWADSDPTASACAVGQLGESGCFPAEALRYTFDGFMHHWRTRMADPSTRTKYSAYDIRVINALVKLGRREDAWEIAGFYLQDRRPFAWNQWPEITWPDPQSPGHLGDLPHSWIGAEYVLAFRCLFVDEYHERLLIGQGLLAEWLQGEGIAIQHWPTAWGALSYKARRVNDQLTLELSGTVAPPGGLEILLPLPDEIESIDVDHPTNVIDEPANLIDRSANAMVKAQSVLRLQCAPARVVYQFKKRNLP